MFDSPPTPKLSLVAVTSTLGLCVLLLSLGPAQAQSRSGRRAAPSVRAPASQSGAGQAAGGARHNRSAPSIPGTKLPQATRPTDPSSSLGPPASPTGPRGSAETSAPGVPDDMPQAPVGGLEWLAAAGAAYAANRLRKQSAVADDEG